MITDRRVYFWEAVFVAAICGLAAAWPSLESSMTAIIFVCLFMAWLLAATVWDIWRGTHSLPRLAAFAVLACGAAGCAFIPIYGSLVAMLLFIAYFVLVERTPYFSIPEEGEEEVPS